MLSKFIFSLLVQIKLIAIFALFLVAMTFEPVFKFLGSGTPLKTCTMPPLWAVRGEKLYNIPTFGTMFTKKIFDRSKGNATKIGLPFQAGAMQCPSGLAV